MTRPLLASRWSAWVLSAITVVATQVLMWNGWNRSGEWAPVTGGTALLADAVYGLACAIPVVGALVFLRRWLSLAVILVALLGLGVSTGRFFTTSQSSTAAFGWFGPLLYGLPAVAVHWLTELCAARFTNRGPEYGRGRFRRH
jgi:hypothetical protein